MPKQKKITQYFDFQRMKVFQQPISIFQCGILLDKDVIIESHNEEIVLGRNGISYIKENCTFIKQ
jgi:hypothetical protein